MKTLRISLLAVCLLASGSVATAPVIEFECDRHESAELIRFSTGTVGWLNIEAAVLEKATISAANGLSFLLPDGGTFFIEDMTARRAGHPDADMRKWPQYLFGLKQAGEEPGAFVQEARGKGRPSADPQNHI